jgi:hypothetical protein
VNTTRVVESYRRLCAAGVKHAEAVRLVAEEHALPFPTVHHIVVLCEGLRPGITVPS